MSKKYNLSDFQLRHLAIICYREQGSNDAGVRACASQMCNYFELWQAKKFRNIYECVFGSGWYWSKARNEAWVANHPDVPTSVIDAVRDVICNGHRTLPEYIDEYDRLKDIAVVINDGIWHTDKDYIMNRSNYHKDKTIIRNKWAEEPGDQYTFYCFPDGPDGICDAFGYINKSIPTKEEKTTMTIPDNACSFAENIAADQSHGYSQANRWGPNYDCSSLVISAYINAGVPIDKNKVYYTGNMQGLKAYGFVDVTDKVDLNTGAGMLRGDILYYHISGTNGHTAMYCGNGNIVHARGQSYGSAASGDQGTEIAVTPYTRSKWQYVLRYKGSVTASASVTQTVTSSTPSTASNATSTAPSTAGTIGGWIIPLPTKYTLETVQLGSMNASVMILQAILYAEGYIGSNGKTLDIDGDFGGNTAYALKAFQAAAGLTADGVCGPKTWSKLKAGLSC